MKSWLVVLLLALSGCAGSDAPTSEEPVLAEPEPEGRRPDDAPPAPTMASTPEHQANATARQRPMAQQDGAADEPYTAPVEQDEAPTEPAEEPVSESDEPAPEEPPWPANMTDFPAMPEL